MTPKPAYQYALASGYNQPIGSLVNIETIKPSGDVYFYPPEGLGNFDPGQEKVRTNGLAFYSGFNETKWTWRGKITLAQARYLMDTYCNGGYSGTVTVLTTTDNKETYTRLNAVMKLPKLPEATRNFKVYTQYQVTLRRLTTAT